jgi:hypothetical protein
MKGAEFTVRGFHPKYPRDRLLVHQEKGLVGVVAPPKDAAGSVKVQLQPGAAITGRLVDADSKPRPAVELEVTFRPKVGREWEDYRPDRVTTDRDGRFRAGPLLPGYEFRLLQGPADVWSGAAPDSGKTKDLGDVRTKRIAD